MDMTYVRMTQDNYNATKHMEQLKANCKAKRTKQIKCRIAVLLATIAVTSMSVAFIPKASASSDDKATEVQEFVVRYGRAWNWGQQVQMNDDRSIIDITDGPELNEGTDVRVLFDTHGTVDPSDDTVIDVTEL